MGLLGRQPRTQRQDRCGAVQRLDLVLRIHADHDGLCQRFEVEPDDVPDLGLQFRVGGELVRLGLLRLQPPTVPELGDGREADPEMISQQPLRPVRDPNVADGGSNVTAMMCSCS